MMQATWRGRVARRAVLGDRLPPGSTLASQPTGRGVEQWCVGSVVTSPEPGRRRRVSAARRKWSFGRPHAPAAPPHHGRRRHPARMGRTRDDVGRPSRAVGAIATGRRVVAHDAGLEPVRDPVDCSGGPRGRDCDVIVDPCATAVSVSPRRCSACSATRVNEATVAAVLYEPADCEPDLVVVLGPPTGCPRRSCGSSPTPSWSSSMGGPTEPDDCSRRSPTSPAPAPLRRSREDV